MPIGFFFFVIKQFVIDCLFISLRASFTKISGDNHHTSAIIPPFCHDLTENRTETPAKKFFRPEVWPYLEADAFHCPLYTRPSTPTSTSQKSILVQVATKQIARPDKRK